jgi:putative membrane protein
LEVPVEEQRVFRPKTIRFREVLQATVVPIIILIAAVGWTKARPNDEGGDAQFVANASAGGLAEVRLGQLAEQRGTSPAVRSFGEKMATDHTGMGKRLQVAAGQEHMTVSNDLNDEDRATYEKLSKLSGAAFDQAYAADMVSDHQHDIRDFEQEAKSGKNPTIRQFAEGSLPTLREHLELAQQMARSVGAQSATR